MFTRPQAESLRQVAARLGLPTLVFFMRDNPAVGEALRLTIQYHDARHPDQVAMLTRRQSERGALLRVMYRRLNDDTLTLDHTITAEASGAIFTVLKRLNFDKLDDQPKVPFFGTDLWMLERAAGMFHHDVILAPQSCTGTYHELVIHLETHLHEALRAINP